MKIRTIVIVFILLLTTACSRSENTLEKFELTPPERIDKKFACPLHDPGCITVHKDDLYIADTGNNRIVIHNTTTEKTLHFGIKGEGPGEFIEPWSICVHNKNLHILDTSLRRVQVFNKITRKLIKSFQMKSGFYLDMQMDKEGNYYLLKMGTGKNNLIEKYNHNGNFITRFGNCLPAPSRKLTFPWNMTTMAIDPLTSDIYLCFRYINLIRIYSPDGKLQKSSKLPININAPLPVMNPDGKAPFKVTHLVSSIAFLENRLIITRGFKNAYGYLNADIYTKDLKHIQTISLNVPAEELPDYCEYRYEQQLCIENDSLYVIDKGSFNIYKVKIQGQSLKR